MIVKYLCYYIFYTSLIFSMYRFVFIEKGNIYSLNKEIEKINKCYKKTKKVTCMRNSNKMYIKKRKSKPYILLLKEYNFNKNKFSVYNCIYLIAIITEPDMFFERTIFRKIYSRYRNISYIFIMGKNNSTLIVKKINEEISEYKDIIQFNFYASYFSLILQTYNILLWSSRLNIYFEWLIKHDTDTFFNIKIFKDLHDTVAKEYHTNIWGYIINNFPSGMGYAIPYILIKKLIKGSKIYINHDCYGPAEDVFIGKIAKVSNVKLLDVRIFNKTIGEGNCFIKLLDNYFMIHRLKPIEIYYLHNIYLNYKYYH